MKYIKYFNKIIYYMIAIVIITFTLNSCNETTNPDNESKAGTFKGSSINLGNGTANSWIKLDDDGNPVSMGLTITADAMTGLDDENMELSVPVPSEASMTNVVDIELDWNPQGHEPKGVYDVPHFDFHFYMVDENFRKQITGQGDDTLKCNKMPGSGYLPDGYMLVPPGVPMMGTHAVDLTSPEFTGGKFTSTFIYGYYDGNMIFFEPMITKDYIMAKKYSEMTIATPQMYPMNGYYPHKYMMEYDETNDVYNVVLTDFMNFQM